MSDSSAFTQLYRLHAPTVFRRARQILGNASDAHEVVQELFLSLFERPEQYHEQSSMVTFLYGATTHACLNRLRNQRNRARLEQAHLEPPSFEDSRLSPETLLQLHQALRSLPNDCCQAAIYYMVDGLTHQEIAGILGCSRRHVGDLLTRLEKFEQEMPQVC
jgi:RNA polymerase sigma-70 factor (ECF subfamily)